MTTFFPLLIRLFVILVMGYVVMFSGQHSLFVYLSRPNIVDLDDWYRYQYSPGANLVFGLSTLAALIWFGIALYYNEKDRRPGFPLMRTIWSGLCALPALSIPLGLSRLTEGQEAAGLLLLFYLLDALWLFWFATALSTPESFKYGVVPGSYFLRHLPLLK